MKSITFFLVLMLVGAASAATVSWENLEATVLDQRVMVRDTDKVSTFAVVRGINDREIILVRENGEALTIPRERVNRVQLWSRSTGAMKGLAWGAGVGAVVYGIGAIRYMATEGKSEEAGMAALMFAAGTAMFAGAAGGIGAAMGGVTTVYEAPKATDVKAKRGFAPPMKQEGTQRAGGAHGPRPLSSSGAEPAAAGHAALPDYLAAPDKSR